MADKMMVLTEEEYVIAKLGGGKDKRTYEQYRLETIISYRIIQMTEEVKFPNDEDAWICTDYIMKDLGFKVEVG